ncbi:ATP-binding cassette domain-containing protein [Cupriavidus taiwanensis]|uniref:ATP-binding protein Uup n=1 Tax=Cupriavidus taiwanensis TaxID=164546 RepID=A0A7Z7JBA5_9BURK|nr:ATP-binding cassette domain-containing protein [Cupriavidus taiwanensis]SOY88465.1 fused ATP-binding subunit of ABC superfamily protein involved in precise excision of transposons [Cupriavidus taiwanensis]SOZ06011.1 fused ATP-binding subunit of ABC superfamily protein involved in precise excision of transposons [Cupriavidus taiwanensis]SOZ07996.1 fused ATP-binding subunit of ABC superfamily protein involved in precise excision of transposons [Cupriavidus taiwanensis]SPC16034.1 fused ATP-bind
MALFSITDAQLAFGHVALLDHTDFSLEAGERVGLIGRNGSGKSSLLKIVAGLAAPDDGLIARQSGVTSAYVPQEPQFAPGITVFDAVSQGMGDAHDLLVRYEAAADRVAEHHDDEAALAELHRLQSELDAAGAWQLRTRVETTLARLGLDSHTRVDALSGGLQKRVALAQALVAEPDILLLDEPTNHLDVEAIRWLEDLLLQFRGSVLLITHDRAFLDRVATRIVELDRGRLVSFPGNFAAYQARKEEMLAAEQVEQAKFDKLLAQEEVWIRKGVEARRTRSVSRIQRLVAMRNERAARREVQGNVRLEVSQADRSGKIVAELTDVSKAYGDKVVVRDFTATIMRGDKVGLIGPNGAGKTTLLRLILGELAPDSGTVRNGSNLQVAYFDQMRTALDLEKSLADTISPGSDWVEVNGQRKHVMSYLGDFLFAPERARSPVKSLSGGERNRLLLARLFARPANVLVLDEPTNDLDIDTLELLEELLQDYGGTVFLVSHDRAFLDNVVTSTLAAEGDGVWRESVGGYSDWVEQSARSAALQAARKPAEQKVAEPARGKDTREARGANRTVKLSYKEQRELDGLPERIAALETEQKTISAQLADGSLYVSDAAKAAQLGTRHDEIEMELLEALERWEVLEAKSKGEGA